MNPRTASSYYARESAAAHRDLGAARAEANRLRDLLSETDRILRQAWRDGRLPAGIIPDDLVERTRAALAGEAAPPLTIDQIAALAASDLASRYGRGT